MPSSWRTWNRSWICITDPTIRIVPSCAWTSSRCSWSRKPAHRWRPRRNRPRRVDYEYERAGTASVFLFSEPLAGWRQATGPGPEYEERDNCQNEARQRGRRPGHRTPSPGTPAVRTDDGELHTGNWPSHRSVFTPEGLKISRAVVYLNREKTVAALNGLGRHHRRRVGRRPVRRGRKLSVRQRSPGVLSTA